MVLDREEVQGEGEGVAGEGDDRLDLESLTGNKPNSRWGWGGGVQCFLFTKMSIDEIFSIPSKTLYHVSDAALLDRVKAFFFFSFFASAFLLLILSTPSFLLADVLFIYFGVQFS